MKFPFFKKSKTIKVSDSVIHPILTSTGIMLCIQRAAGGFESRELVMPVGCTTGGRSWFVGQPIRLKIAGTQLLMEVGPDSQVQSDQTATLHPAVLPDVVLYEGTPTENEALLLAIRSAWLDANLPKAANIPAQAPTSNENVFSQRRKTPLQQKKWALGAALASVVGLMAITAIGMKMYLSPRGPSMDLSTMSVNDIAQLDLNPAALRSMQDQMLAAVKAGQDEATKVTGSVETSHLGALKSMGLDPGVSAKNAMSCLATK